MTVKLNVWKFFFSNSYIVKCLKTSTILDQATGKLFQSVFLSIRGMGLEREDIRMTLDWDETRCGTHVSPQLVLVLTTFLRSRSRDSRQTVREKADFRHSK